MRRHAARPFLVVDNSQCIRSLRAQKVLGQRHIFYFCHFGDGAAELPRNAIGLPFVHALSVNGLARPLTYPSRDNRAAAQFLDKVRVILHGKPIVREIFGFVNTDNSDDLNWRRIDTSDMANSESKSSDAVAAGLRLSWLRGALDYSVRRDYAKFLATRTTEDWEIWEGRLEKYEDGDTMLPVAVARLLRKLHKVPYEWLYDEEWEQVPHGLYQALKDYQKITG